jgi:hypothetical protein
MVRPGAPERCSTFHSKWPGQLFSAFRFQSSLTFARKARCLLMPTHYIRLGCKVLARINTLAYLEIKKFYVCYLSKFKDECPQRYVGKKDSPFVNYSNSPFSSIFYLPVTVVGVEPSTMVLLARRSTTVLPMHLDISRGLY